MNASIGLGKIILLGEHAVVYGYPALAAALDRGVSIAAVPHLAGGAFRIDVPAWNIRVLATDDHPVAHSLCAIADSLNLGRPSITLTGDAQIPPGAGLGSSAALAVAVARAMLVHAKQPAENAVVVPAAHASEELMHGRASGIDVTFASSGGIGVFRRGTAGRDSLDRSNTVRYLKRISLRVLVGSSGEPRSTAKMVEMVSAATRAIREDARLKELGSLADTGTTALLSNDLAALGTTMNRAHAILAGLGVSTPQLDALCASARAAGAYGSKLTGAGGGGAIIAIAPRDKEKAVLDTWKVAGVTGFVATVGDRSHTPSSPPAAGGA